MSNDEKLTVLVQKELWYSPLFVNDVELENILFYNSIDGVIFQLSLQYQNKESINFKI